MGLTNKNRGYQQLRVWQDAVGFYKLSSEVFRKFLYDLKRVASQAIAASDSVHRNIAEGYCRRSIREYLNFLNIALGSLGESVSGLYAYKQANHITEEDFKILNDLAYRLENGLLKLVESPERKQLNGDWIDRLIVKEKQAGIWTIGVESTGTVRKPITPALRHSITPLFETLSCS